MQMRNYLIQYELIFIHFQNRNLNIGHSQVQNSCFILLTAYRGDFGDLFL